MAPAASVQPSTAPYYSSCPVSAQSPRGRRKRPTSRATAALKRSNASSAASRTGRGGGAPLGDDHRRALLSLIHDRTTETVFASFDETEQLFRHYPPQPLKTVDVLSGGSRALEQANRDMGLALSEDEIAYLAENFA